jgi:2-polyprenyl-3-methyl-5-hydroxy-6-metoxy-1,4-benzoquinol methylase
MTMNPTRSLTSKDLAYETISDQWDSFVDLYDTSRRLEVVVDDFLANKIEGKDCLDGGCGLGFFTKRLMKYSPRSVTAVDIAESLVKKLSAELPQIIAKPADLLALDRTLTEQYDVVVSSEVVEHTPDPKLAVTQLAARVKSGGYLSISTPNVRWIWTLHLAHFLRIRKPYQGYENWSKPSDLTQWLEDAGMVIERKRGIHLFPWQPFPKFFMRWVDAMAFNFGYAWSVNLAVLARKK